MPKNDSDRKSIFLKAVKDSFTEKDRLSEPKESFGASNRCRPLPVEKRVLLGAINLEKYDSNSENGFVACSLITFLPEVELWYAFYIRSGINSFNARIKKLVEFSEGKTRTVNSYSIDNGEKNEQGKSKFKLNNNVRFLLSMVDGKVYLTNKEDDEGFIFDNEDAQPEIEIDKITYALYPPGKTARQNLGASEFIGSLQDVLGEDKIQEIVVPWQEQFLLPEKMLRLPKNVELSEIMDSIKNQGLFYSEDLITKYHIALNHLSLKHFVILTGLSGSGKTSLVRAYSNAVHGFSSLIQEDPLLFFCAVRPEWTDPTGLLGYFDILNNQYIVPPFLQAVITADSNRSRPVFVCLDEMNIARVEYYLSDILSTMETGGRLFLHTFKDVQTGNNGLQIPNQIPFPPNLYIIGTVNIDETTYTVSDKVLDRAVVIDMSEINIEGFFKTLSKKSPELEGSINDCRDILIRLYELLKPHRLQFGYRVLEEFIRYYYFSVYRCQQPSKTAIDSQILQKIIVKLRGDDSVQECLNRMSALFEKNEYKESQVAIDGLVNELKRYNSFQYSR